MRRIKVTLQSKNQPEFQVQGHALTQDLEGQLVSFFTSQKLPLDEDFTLSYFKDHEMKTIQVRVHSLNEQVSSGRVMNTVPDSDHLFPVQKFYRWYSKNLDFTPAVQAEPVEESKAA